MAARKPLVLIGGQVSQLPAGDTLLGVAWGGIGGVLADQADLQAALDGKLSLSGGTLTGALNSAPAVTLASASTVNIGAAAANTINIAGTTTITGLGTIAAGARRTLIFGGALTLTHSATKLILPGAANIVTAVGDVAGFESLGAGNWKCVGYVRANGRALVTDASSLVWGGIGGALANQADLQAALDSKLNAALADFTIIYPNSGSAAAPATAALNAQYITPNPFPGFNVITKLEVRIADGSWHSCEPSILGNGSPTGAACGQVGDTIVVRTCLSYLIYNSGGYVNSTAPGTVTLGALPCRVKVWKVKA